MLGLEVDRGWHAQVGGRVVRAAPFEVIDEWRDAGGLAFPAPADHQRVQQRLALGPRVQEAGVLGRTQPLVDRDSVDVLPV